MTLRFAPRRGSPVITLSSVSRGPQGAAATIDVGTVTTGAPGTSAAVVNVGTDLEAVFNFTIPRGDVGALTAIPDGSVSTGGLAWASDPTSTIYRIAANRYGYSIAGVLKYEMNATDWILPGNPTVNLGAATKQYVDAGFQPIDADLTALAALSSTGFAVRTTSNTWAQRTLTGTTNKVTITNGDGISGNPTFTVGSLVLQTDTAATLTVGFTATDYDAGTKSSGTFTPDPANSNVQHCVNGGAFTLAPPANPCSIQLDITNNGSAGAITTSGFTKVTGDAFDTTNAHAWRCWLSKGTAGTHLHKQAMF